MKDNNLKILFYADILWNFDYYAPARVMHDHFDTYIYQPLSEKFNLDVKTITTELTSNQAKESNLLEHFNIAPISLEEIKKPFGPEYFRKDIFFKEYSENGLSDEEKNYYANLIKSKLGDWKPDVIFCLAYVNSFLKELFPNTLILSQENAIFSSRPPFMRTLFYDPLGFGGYSFLKKYKEEIKNFKLTEEQNYKVQKFKHSLNILIDNENPIKEEIKEVKKQFDKLILVALGGVCGALSETDFKHDFDYMLYLMNNIPENVGVIVTQHDNGNESLSAQMISYLRNKYKNFIYFEKIHTVFGAASMHFFEYVDAVINLGSTTEFQSLLWNTRVISMDKKYTWYCDKQGIENITEFLNEPIKNKNNILYWYLTHYAIFDRDNINPDFISKYFLNKLEKFKQENVTFNYFEQINDFDEISEFILSHVKNYYDKEKQQKFEQQIQAVQAAADENKRIYDENLVQLMEETKLQIINTVKETVNQQLSPIQNNINQIQTKLNKPTFIQKIFSVKNEGNHKVFRIFGIKLKFRKTNKETGRA